jgi:D-tyrosyl-tRNA(Tyr) deacylase
MKAVIQRVKQASVSVRGSVVSSIGPGLLVFLGVEKTDTEAQAQKLARKIAALRIFDDQQGKMNLSVNASKGDVLVVSQFTICADLSRGNRPSFDTCMPPQKAQELYNTFLQLLKEHLEGKVAQGSFGAFMQIELTNDGPATFILQA